MGRYHHDFEPGEPSGKTPVPAHKRVAVAYFILALTALVIGLALPFLAAIF